MVAADPWEHPDRSTDRSYSTTVCDGCGVKYSPDIAGRICPVCNHERAPDPFQMALDLHHISRSMEGIDYDVHTNTLTIDADVLRDDDEE